MMVDIGRRAGKKMCALITDMDRPLGNTVGNTLEVIEAIDVLRGCAPQDVTELCVALAAHMLTLAEKGTYEVCEANVRRVIQSGEALQKLAHMVEAQGGNAAWVYDTSLFPTAKYERTVRSPADGYITAVDAEGYGVAGLILGAGRNTKDDQIDMTAGIRLLKKTGDRVQAGEPIAVLYTSRDEALLNTAEKRLLDATSIGTEQPVHRPLIYQVINA
jgi:pyrimidine-nucleoside phosphorylase